MHDMVFMHPPVSFRKIDFPLGGIFESGTGTTDLLTMMPLGMLSLANELRAAGMDALVVNVAKRTQEVRYEPRAMEAVEEYVRGFPARIYGIGLHWAAHASGAIELARMVKRMRPESAVVLGGLTATYFTDEILESYPFVDAVVQGECDGHIAGIAHALMDSRPRDCDNLAYRLDGAIRRTRVLPPDLAVVDYVDAHGLVHPAPRADRLEREVILCHVPVVRGCGMECLYCGGCRSAYRDFFHRPRVDVLPVPTVLDQIRRSHERGVGLGGIKLFGDIRLGGKEYCDDLLDGIRSLRIECDVLLEIFWPATRDFLAPWREAARDLYVSFCPESCHRDLREAHGKGFDNEELLDQVRLYRDLDIIVWLGFIYPLPGHTHRKLMEEVDFLEKILAVDPTATTMLQPYLFVDPAAPFFERPGEHGLVNRFSTLADIKQGMERSYWFHTIGFRTSEISEREYHEAILDVTVRKAKLYHRSNRLSARDLLKTCENVRCNREIGRIVTERPGMDDADIAAAIDRVFPPYLRRTNSNLIIRPYFGEAADQPSSPEAMVHDAFPIALELVLAGDADSVERVSRRIVDWLGSRAGELRSLHASCVLPGPLRDLVSDLLGPLGLPGPFVRDLSELEWDVYRLLYFEEPGIEGAAWKGRVLKKYGYDMTDIDEVVESARYGRPSPGETHYLFDEGRREVLTMSFDPRAVAGSVEDAVIRRMSTAGRRIIRAERTVHVVLSRMTGRPEPLRPEVLASGGTLSRERIEELLTSLSGSSE